ncbi:TRAP transporter small permease [Yoonia sp. BS5-3]|uniref:TRAP transporter small permease protein n=1 Tax=Yoonia phaeophyticola TaxID=3137369 RepID=A0ABZ2V5C6_9RHOB
MSRQSGHLLDWIVPVFFVICAGWTVWHLPAFLLDFVSYENESKAIQIQDYFDRKQITPGIAGLGGGNVDVVDWIALILMPITFVIGVCTVVPNQMEFQQHSKFDQIAMFIGRITMILIILMTGVMLYEVFVRYAIEAPTLWANELTLWIAGFIFMLSGVYGMQQRSHIRIFILYEVLPRWGQHICDVLSVLLLWFFTACLLYGSYHQVFVGKFYNWQTFGTAFDPPLPATIQPIILISITLVSIQAFINLIADWNRDPSALADKDVVDAEELEALKKSVGDS